MFKKKLSPYEAAAHLIHIAANRFRENWDTELIELNKMLDDKQKINDEDYADYEILLALLSTELIVVNNLSPEKYHTVFSCVLNLASDTEGFEEYSFLTLKNDYPRGIAEAKKRGELEIEGIIQVLAEKLDITLNPLRGTLLMQMVIKNAGIWKNIVQNYKIS
ncbi:hypothetical protein LOZ80_37900 [Paenibacillus sp. HWE-109]|uniref:hypothetical protein n=1 Tax=Paenibacillus sp. HWE-109 TaxID=1306526 RepID=UPI001EDCEE2B|nr:hypothetical protein [Paenibacillus sp. HWE-109]UKS27166.1 hypothetical protein LOZ80_37900 [Paenibacillus sp. HWE-109]